MMPLCWLGYCDTIRHTNHTGSNEWTSNWYWLQLAMFRSIHVSAKPHVCFMHFSAICWCFQEPLVACDANMWPRSFLSISLDNRRIETIEINRTSDRAKCIIRIVAMSLSRRVRLEKSKKYHRTELVLKFIAFCGHIVSSWRLFFRAYLLKLRTNRFMQQRARTHIQSATVTGEERKRHRRLSSHNFVRQMRTKQKKSNYFK